MEFETQHTELLLDVMRWRRDVRHFSRQPVSDAQLATLKAAMDLAPSVGNSRPWRVVQVMSPEARAAILSSHQSANEEAAQRYEAERRAEYAALKLQAIREAPVQLAVFIDPDPKEGDGLGRQTMPETLAYSAVAAIHNLWLVARTMNLGVGWVSILHARDLHAALDVPETWELIAYLCVGHPASQSDTPELERAGWQKRVIRDWDIR